MGGRGKLFLLFQHTYIFFYVFVDGCVAKETGKVGSQK